MCEEVLLRDKTNLTHCQEYKVPSELKISGPGSLISEHYLGRGMQGRFGYLKKVLTTPVKSMKNFRPKNLHVPELCHSEVENDCTPTKYLENNKTMKKISKNFENVVTPIKSSFIARRTDLGDMSVLKERQLNWQNDDSLLGKRSVTHRPSNFLVS
jgi:hypothetical protein